MKKENIYLSTIATDAVQAAKEFGVKLEIAEYCTAWNMDEKFGGVDQVVRKKLDGISQSVLHAPFNELFPCAIDKKARALAAERYRQAIELAKRYGSTKVIIHGGYNPWIYYPVWYVEQSILFWKEFLKEDPGVEIVLENVLETEPQWLLDIAKGVDDPRLKLCLDIGHVYLPKEKTDKVELLSPVDAPSLEDMPETYIELAEFDCLHDGGRKFADRLINEGVKTEVVETVSTMHGYDFASGNVRETV